MLWAQEIADEITVRMVGGGPDWATIILSVLSPIVALGVVFYSEWNTRIRWQEEKGATHQRWSEEREERRRETDREDHRLLGSEVRVVVARALQQCHVVYLACQRYIEYPAMTHVPGTEPVKLRLFDPPEIDFGTGIPGSSSSRDSGAEQAADSVWALQSDNWRRGMADVHYAAWTEIAQLRTSAASLEVLGQAAIGQAVRDAVELIEQSFSSNEVPDFEIWEGAVDAIIRAAHDAEDPASADPAVVA